MSLRWKPKKPVREIVNGQLYCNAGAHWQPLDNFNDRKHGSHGKQAICRSCSKAYQVRRYGETKTTKRTYGVSLSGMPLRSACTDALNRWERRIENQISETCI